MNLLYVQALDLHPATMPLMKSVASARYLLVLILWGAKNCELSKDNRGTRVI